MILYKKTSSLGKNKSFSDYIQQIKGSVFSPYILQVKEIVKARKYDIEISLSGNSFLLNTVNTMFGGVLLNKYTIEYFKEKREFTLSASVRYLLLFLSLFYIFGAFAFLALIFVMLSDKNASPDNIFPVIVIAFASIAPVASLYLQERRLLDRLGSLGSEL